MARLASKATNAVLSWLQSNLPARLRLVEIDEGQGAGWLPDPQRYIKGPIHPIDSPCIMVSASGGGPRQESAGQRLRMHEWEISIGLYWKADPNTEENYTRLYAFVTAIYECFEEVATGSTLGGLVNAAILNDAGTEIGPLVQVQDQTPTSLGATISLTVRTDD